MKTKKKNNMPAELRVQALRSSGALPPLMSVSEAATALGITRQGLWAAINRGYVETVKSGPYTLVPRHAVERYAVAARKPGRPLKRIV